MVKSRKEKVPRWSVNMVFSPRMKSHFYKTILKNRYTMWLGNEEICKSYFAKKDMEFFENYGYTFTVEQVKQYRAISNIGKEKVTINRVVDKKHGVKGIVVGFHANVPEEKYKKIQNVRLALKEMHVPEEGKIDEKAQNICVKAGD